MSLALWLFLVSWNFISRYTSQGVWFFYIRYVLNKLITKEEESASKNGDSSDNDDNDEKGMYDKAGKLKKMKHEQQKENAADQVNYVSHL